MTRTFGYGLNVGKTDSLAEYHVVYFLLRRLIFAICIVFKYENVSLAVHVLLASCICMISLLSQWNLWEDYWIGL